jgi:hypothetical protein
MAYQLTALGISVLALSGARQAAMPVASDDVSARRMG